MSEFDNLEAQINSLHEEAEELASQGLRAAATRKIRQAARLRAQLGED